jgi:hypothetical protein
MYTRTSMPSSWPASASEQPHWPAPVSVVRRRMPAARLYQACGIEVFGLWEPAGLTDSFL